MNDTVRVQCIVADPPWQFDDKIGKRGAGANYQTLNFYELCSLAWPQWIEPADDCYLFLWKVASMPLEAYRLLDSWGFTPKTEIVWQKLTKNGKPWFGMGHHVRASHETAIVATRGKPKRLRANVRSTFSAPVPLNEDGLYRHSAKPELFQDIVESFCQGPRLELFARRRRSGWHCVGNELCQCVLCTTQDHFGMPTYNHSADDSTLTPCHICAQYLVRVAEMSNAALSEVEVNQ